MKTVFKTIIAASTFAFASSALASTLTLPTTMDAGSVQAKLKSLLVEKLHSEGEIVNDFGATLTSSNGKVTLEDQSSKLVCSEFSQGFLAVQQFACQLTVKDGLDAEVNEISLDSTMGSASVQAVLKSILFDALQTTGAVVSDYEANLTGNYSGVTLEDDASKVECLEQSADFLAVQTFTCTFSIK